MVTFLSLFLSDGCLTACKWARQARASTAHLLDFRFAIDQNVGKPSGGPYQGALLCSGPDYQSPGDANMSRTRAHCPSAITLPHFSFVLPFSPGSLIPHLSGICAVPETYVYPEPAAACTYPSTGIVVEGAGRYQEPSSKLCTAKQYPTKALSTGALALGMAALHPFDHLGVSSLDCRGRT